MPDWQQYVRTQLPALRVKPERAVGIIEELALQLEQAYLDALKAGHTEAEAERMAKDQLPDWQKLALDIELSQPPQHRPASRLWQGLPGDFRQALRLLQKSPVFTAVAIATLAIGIGGCTSIFSLIDAVILRPIDYARPDQLVMVWEKNFVRGAKKNVVAMADYLDWKARNHVFSDMSPILDQVWNVSGHGQALVLKGISVNERFLPMLGVQPLLGRSFLPEETESGRPGVAILSHRVWVEMFGASRDAIGRTITLDDSPRVIVGVLPADFPWLGKPLDILTATRLRNRDWRANAGRFLRVAARLNAGLALPQAQREMSAIARQLEVEYPDFNKGWGVELVPMADQFAAGAGTALWVLMGAVGVVLLIACSNVANLMLARAVVREREMALRAALGATTGRLVRLLMVESFTLALIGGIIGCSGAYVAIRLVQAYGPQDIGRLESAGLDAPVVLFALAISLFTGIAFGLAPAIGTGRLNLGAALKDGGRGMLNTVRGVRLRNVFVVAQVGLALVLLTSATLLIQSLYRLSQVPTGFDPHNVLTGTINVSGNIDNAKLGTLCSRIVERLRSLPGVEDAGFITYLPFTGLGAATGFNVIGRPAYPPSQAPVTDVRVVQPGYFETMRIPLLRGRLFNGADNQPDAPRRFLVNETLVRQIFGKQDPLGQSLTVMMGDDKPGQIVGVVGDTKHLSLDGDIRPMVYYVQAHLPISFGSFVMRTKVQPELMASEMAAVIHEVKKDQPVSDVRSMDDWIGRSIARMRFQAALLGSFAFVAMVLAVIGVYGVMAYSVEQRTNEIGVRLALGAEPRMLKRWITAQGMRLTGIGLALGLIAAAASTRVLSSLLFGVEPGDPKTFLIAAAVLAAACLPASYIPARRATGVDPVVALRRE
jgi:putative ABC transport system permease protein